MNSYPMLQMDLDKIQANAAAVAGICAAHGIKASGVVKGVCGSPEAASAMLAVGVS